MFVGGGVGTADGILVGKVVKVIDGDGVGNIDVNKDGTFSVVGISGVIDGDGVGNIVGNKVGTSSVVGIIDGDGVGMMEGIVIGETSVGSPVGDEGIKDCILVGTNVVGRHVGDIVGITNGTVVGDGVSIGEGVLVGVEEVSNADSEGVDNQGVSRLASFVVGQTLLEGVGTVDGVVVGEAVKCRAVFGGEGNRDGAAHSRYVIGDIVGRIVGSDVGGTEGTGLVIGWGDVSWIPYACRK